MKIWQAILGVALFALSTMIVYIWGLKKSVNQSDDLNRRLYNVCGGRVVRQMKKTRKITKDEIAVLIEGVSVGQPWSRSRIKVESGKKAADGVVDFLLDQQYIEEIESGVYRLKK